MAKIKTPLLRPLREHGATLYTFPSASEDISLNINSSTQGVAMSHYALLNFTKNNFPFKTPGDIVLSLQNWLMNSEAVLLNQPTYNFQENKTVSERVFWNWVNTQSGGRLFETTPVYDDVYREVNYKTADRDRLVQCFGVIDSGNHLSTEFGMFNEVYVNIPTSYGNGPVFFESVSDDTNYSKNIEYKTGDIIQGRSTTDRTYISSKDALKPANAVYTDPNGFEIVKDVVSLTKICQELTNNKSLSISSFDDVNIDYLNQFSNLDGLNINNIECQFKFNAILLYYSIYDLNDVNKDAVATNLFGIVFLDGGAGVGDDTYMLAPVLKKKSYKSQNSSSSYFGNGYSFRVNIKTLSVYDNTDAIIEDNTTSTSIYSQDFSDVVSALNKAIDLMNVNTTATSAIQDRYMEMCTQYVDIQNRFNDIQTNLTNQLTDKMAAVLEEFTDKYQTDIANLRASLGIDDSYDITDPGAGADSPDYVNPGSIATEKPVQSALINPIMNHLYPELKVNIQKQLGSSRMLSPENDRGVMSDTKVDILSATDTNVNAKNNINLTGKEILLNFKTSDNKVSKVPLSGLIEKYNKLETELNEVKEYVEKRNSEMAAILELTGIVPVVDILPPRAKKPDISGFYLKENTAGNITQLVMLNENKEYEKPVECQAGKLYSVNGKIYIFNGETCKPLGL